MTTPSILINSSRGLHHVLNPVERDLATAAEVILRDLGAEVQTTRVWVHCSDADMKTRLTSYVQQLKEELVADLEHVPQQA